jgi:hypothetical protein
MAIAVTGTPHIRTAGDNRPQAITFIDAITEINAAAGGHLRKSVEWMTCVGTTAIIDYRDGVRVFIRPAGPSDIIHTDTPAASR